MVYDDRVSQFIRNKGIIAVICAAAVGVPAFCTCMKFCMIRHDVNMLAGLCYHHFIYADLGRNIIYEFSILIYRSTSYKRFICVCFKKGLHRVFTDQDTAAEISAGEANRNAGRIISSDRPAVIGDDMHFLLSYITQKVQSC